ncbi:MAG: hypothetical protein ACTSR2_11540, partial [Candidatus Hodarchaeales archaeon]
MGNDVWAADLEVDFEKNPLFSKTADGHWFPGRSETRQVTVTNNSDNEKTVIVETLNEIAPKNPAWNLAKVLELKISANGFDIYGGTLGKKYLADFYKETELPLSILLTKHSVVYNFTVSMDKSLGNDWQNRNTGFDLKIGFWGITPTSTPTPAVSPVSPTSTPVPSTPSGCTATAPTSAPTLLDAVAGVNSVTLTWSSVSPVTHYLIAYGLTPGNYIYGNPNVGNITNYTVTNLARGTT